jgi:hypothetical protein
MNLVHSHLWPALIVPSRLPLRRLAVVRYMYTEGYEEKENEMSERVDLACTVCAERFLVPIGVYRSHSGVVICPGCGSTDLVLLGVRVAAGEGLEAPHGSGGIERGAEAWSTG